MTAIIIDDRGNVWCGPHYGWQRMYPASPEPGQLGVFCPDGMPVVVYDSVEQAEKQAERLRRKFKRLTLSDLFSEGFREVAVVS